jgi:hypothetical protein
MMNKVQKSSNSNCITNKFPWPECRERRMEIHVEHSIEQRIPSKTKSLSATHTRYINITDPIHAKKTENKNLCTNYSFEVTQ